MAKGDLPGAIDCFKKATVIDPEFSDGINALGTMYLHQGHIGPAIEEFARAIAVDPHAPAPYYNLAIAYLRQDRYIDGERAARRVVDLDRVGVHGHLVLGIALVLQKKFTAEAEAPQAGCVRFCACYFMARHDTLRKGRYSDARNQLEIYLRTVLESSLV
jgi:tetratricopeptide (TPR) repeat protein